MHCPDMRCPDRSIPSIPIDHLLSVFVFGSVVAAARSRTAVTT